MDRLNLQRLDFILFISIYADLRSYIHIFTDDYINSKFKVFNMEKFKIHSSANSHNFTVTNSYRKIYKIFKMLKNKKGKIIHVTGAPGTGKSANIYFALNQLDLSVYNVKFEIQNKNMSSKEVFNSVYSGLKHDLDLKKGENVYKRLSQFDVVLIADAFHDSHLENQEVIGYSQWVTQAGFKSIHFYLLCIGEYLRHHKDFKKINLVLQTTWRIYIGGKKYDLFSELGIFSKFIVFILQRIFIVIEISYSDDEIVEIVKKHLPSADDNYIMAYIKKYGPKPRFICRALESEE